MSRGRPWTDDEEFFILDNPQLTAEEVGAVLGRTRSSVKTRRGRMLARPNAEAVDYQTGFGSKGSRHSEPWKIGSRTLVAKTCPQCGLLLDASWFYRKEQGRWRDLCKKCVRSRASTDPEVLTSYKRAQLERDRLTQDRASSRYEPYTERDVAVISSPELTIYEMALTLGRSISSVEHARRRYDVADRATPLGEPVETWVIQAPLAPLTRPCESSLTGQLRDHDHRDEKAS